ncbi:MAG TPA: CcdB family protein [Caulobacteraceae bacterium]|nr:CcdB family protein [Caulobacteraceae bacterium]
MIRQFDVVQNPEPSMRDKAPYLVVLQSHFLDALTTVIVAPLIPSHIVQTDGAISLPVAFNGQDLTLDVGLLANIDRRRLRRAVGNLSEHDYAISRAIDRLFTGF